MTGSAAPADYRQFAAMLSGLQGRVQRLETRDVLQNASIGENGLQVIGGGSITVSGGGSITVLSGGSISLPTGTLSAAELVISDNGTITNTLTVGTINSGPISSGPISVSGNLATTGQVISAGVVKSPGSYAYVVSTGYVACWINNDGSFGYSPSTRASKKNLTPMRGRTALSQAVTPYWGHYLTDADDDPLRVFLVAEEVAAAGYGPDLVPLNEDGEIFTLNYAQIVPLLLRDIITLYDEVERLKTQNTPSPHGG